METIYASDLPEDYVYYRSFSPYYRQYLEKDCWLKIQELKNWNRFWWMKRLLFFFNVAKFERTNEEPDIKRLQKNWFRHGIVLWIPSWVEKIPDWWKKFFMVTHFTTTWYSVIEWPDYYKNWKDRAKRARKKFFTFKEVSIEEVDHETFSKYYKEYWLRKSFKSAFIRYHKKISNYDKKWNIKNLVCLLNGKPIAWLSVYNYNSNSSVHLVAFLTKEAKKYQAWTWLIDYWYKISYESWIKYINFDHLKDKYMTSDQQWYTTFKENFMDYKVIFPDSYYKLI